MWGTIYISGWLAKRAPTKRRSERATKTNELAKIRAIETIMKSQECSYPEASELFEKLPNAVPMSDQAN